MPPIDRRAMILEHAARLFAEQGIRATTVRGIAESVGMLSGSLYHHFDSKDAMVEAIVVTYLQDLTQRYTDVVLPQTDSRSQLRDLVLASLQAMHDHQHASEIYQANRNYFQGKDRFRIVLELAAEVQSTWTGVIDSGVAAGVFRADVSARVFHRFLRDSVFLTSRWYRPSDIYGIEDLAEDTATIFLDGFTLAGAPTPG